MDRLGVGQYAIEVEQDRIVGESRDQPGAVLDINAPAGARGNPQAGIGRVQMLDQLVSGSLQVLALRLRKIVAGHRSVTNRPSSTRTLNDALAWGNRNRR